ncbi:ABC transporter ATP-binding protein [Streptococcus uberis]|nr:ABC transporter ATP-binding protein [Streptococcus uberis]
MGSDKYDLHGDSIIKAKDLTFTYAARKAFSCQVENLDIKNGELIVLCGKSGSGKSTFLKLLNGLVPDYFPGHLEGQLTIGEQIIGQVSVEDLSRRVASVFQNPSSQFFYKEVKHELVFPCENQGLEPEKIQKKLAQVAHDFTFSDLLERDMFSLSGGQKQRVAIASAIMQGPDIILFDEPTANLDSQGIASVTSYLHALKKAGKTVIVAEHRLSYLKDLADRYLYFRDGALVETFTNLEMLQMTSDLREIYGLRCLDVIPVQEKLENLMVTRTFDAQNQLVIRDLQVKAGKKKLAFIDYLTFERGVITGIVGPNGIGKSRFATYLAGLYEDKKATFTLDKQPLLVNDRLAKSAIVMQDVRLQLFADTVYKELTLGRTMKESEALAIQSVCQELGLNHLLDKHPMSLSGGEQQRLMIASCLLSDKDILIFDEPTSGLDLEHMIAVSRLLKQLKAKGKLIVLISHDEELLSDTCDRIYKMPS